MHRVHLIISGDVQGVGFRAWALRQAQNLQLTGWVKNREDGVVEIVAEGSQNDVEEFEKHCRDGPEISWVEHVSVSWEPARDEFSLFEVIY